MKTLLAIILSLTLTAPALADYSGSAVLDWSSLQFSGVPVQMDTFGPNVQWTAYLLQNPGAIIHLQSQAPSDEFRTSTEAFTYAPLGSVSASATDSSLSASVSLSAVGDVDASAFASRQMGFQVMSTGTFTMSVPYLIQHAGLPPLTGTDFTTTLHAGIALGGGNLNTVEAVATLNEHSPSLQQSGLLTLTREFQAGDRGSFGLNVDITTHRGGSVPVPDMLWPTTFLGLAGLGWLWLREWRRVR